MSDPLIENFEIGLYEQYLEELEKKYYRGVITWGPDEGDAYYSKTQKEMEEEAQKLVKEFMDRNS
tara:strand:+ start:210 stop:404 length:195 start_codon:yes stop_codon:yes gene_type:complete